MNNHHPPHDEDRQARLTAYALNQLDERERAIAAAELSRSPEDQQFVEQTRLAAKLLKDDAQQAAVPSATLRGAVEEHLQKKEQEAMPTVNKTKPERSLRPWLALAVAVCLLLMLVPLAVWRTGPRLVGLHNEQSDRALAENTAAASTETSVDEQEELLSSLSLSSKNFHDTYVPGSADVAGSGLAASPIPAPAEKTVAEVDQFNVELESLNFELERELRLAPVNGLQEKKQSQSLGRAKNRTGFGLGDSRRAGPLGKAPAAGYSGMVLGMRMLKDKTLGGGRSNQPASNAKPDEYGYQGRRARLNGKNDAAPAFTPPVELTEETLPEDVFRFKGKADTNAPNARVASSDELSTFRTELHAFHDKRVRVRELPSNEQYAPIIENTFQAVQTQPLSTFSIDVDTASYANVRRFLTQNQRPPAAAVRIEELINYFHYDYPAPQGEQPFSVNLELADCPWQPSHRLLRVGLKGQEIDRSERGASNIVFLLDVSGSMRDADKLPLVKQGMKMLVEQMGEDDRVAIVTYAGNAGLVLPSTSGDKKDIIRRAIDNMAAGGSTNGGAGIQLAYDVAVQHFVKGGANRVILATDGDLNVGLTSDNDLVRLIEEKAASGVFLTVLGFGTGNLKDAKMEKIADQGNGMYAYIDSTREAYKVLVEQMTGSLVTIAKDVKIQIEFNPREISSYRLIGYENRALAAEDFADDKKDAGEIGAGHTVTALFELVPVGAGNVAVPPGLKYQKPPQPKPQSELTTAAESGELLTVKLRYKQPDGQVSQLLEKTLQDNDASFSAASQDFRFATSVAAFGMLLRSSKYAGSATWSAVESYAMSAIGEDAGGYRREFLDLIRKARNLSK